jgi:SAM-dependent methyltransferase
LENQVSQKSKKKSTKSKTNNTYTNSQTARELAKKLLLKSRRGSAYFTALNNLKTDKGILQLEKGQLEAEIRELKDQIVNPKPPHPPTNPIGFVPKSVKKTGQAYREFFAGRIYGSTTPKIKGLPNRKDNEYLQIGLGRYGDGRFGPRWIVVDLYDPSPAVDFNYDVQDLPKGWSGRFDLTQCNAIFEHIPYPQKAVNELYRVLKPGGFIYVELPFLQQYHTGGDSTIGKKYHFGGDYWRATVEGLRVWMAEFDEISCGWGNEGVVYFFGRKPVVAKKVARPNA